MELSSFLFVLLFNNFWSMARVGLLVVGEPCFTRNTALQGMKCVDDLAFSETEVRSKLDCAALCLRHPLCVVMFHSDFNKICVGCRSLSATLGVMGGSTCYTKNSALEHLGCYLDCATVPCVRAMNKHSMVSSSMTIEMCQSFCQSYGTTYFAVQDKDECYCDDVYDVYGPATTCVSPCNGNASQTCGGFSVYSAYGYGSTC